MGITGPAGGSARRASPHLPRPQGDEALWRDRVGLQGFAQGFFWCVIGFIAQMERPPMRAERLHGAAITHDLHRLAWIDVLPSHEPARLIGANRKDRDGGRAKFFAQRAKETSVAIAGVPCEIDEA